MVVPGFTPVTWPVSEPIVAIDELLLLVHKPPDTASDKEAVVPAHTVNGLLIGPGEGLTATTMPVAQPLDNV